MKPPARSALPVERWCGARRTRLRVGHMGSCAVDMRRGQPGFPVKHEPFEIRFGCAVRVYCSVYRCKLLVVDSQAWMRWELPFARSELVVVGVVDTCRWFWFPTLECRCYIKGGGQHPQEREHGVVEHLQAVWFQRES